MGMDDMEGRGRISCPVFILGCVGVLTVIAFAFAIIYGIATLVTLMQNSGGLH